MEDTKIDVIVVGGGPAGVSAAITLAHAGKRVVLVERGIFSGSKNMFGGQIFTSSVRDIFPDFEEKAPLERAIWEHKYMILGENDSTSISYKKNMKSGYTVIRAKWDRWCVEEAKKAGVYFIPETLVEGLVMNENKVVGIKTAIEEFLAPITIIADGVNSLLVKQLNPKRVQKPDGMALSVKEVYELNSVLINQRFNLKDNQGTAIEIIGEPFNGMFGLGFIYTNKDSISLGIGVGLEQLKNTGIKPYELLDNLKKHPEIAPFFEGAKLKEYSAHLIPEDGYKNLPNLYGNGFLVAGDAAGFVNNVHFEGTNLAMISGKLAGESAILALEHNDFSENMLSIYKKKLNQSFVLKDLKTYDNVAHTIEKNSKIFLGFYPSKINEFFNIFVKADGMPKGLGYRKFIKDVLKKRNIFAICTDMLKLLCIAFGVLKR